MSDASSTLDDERKQKFRTFLDQSSTVAQLNQKVEVDRSIPTYICFLSSPNKTRCFLSKHFSHIVIANDQFYNEYYRDSSILKITMDHQKNTIIELVNSSSNPLEFNTRIPGDPTSKYIIYIITIKSFNIKSVKALIQSLVLAKIRIIIFVQQEI